MSIRAFYQMYLDELKKRREQKSTKMKSPQETQAALDEINIKLIAAQSEMDSLNDIKKSPTVDNSQFKSDGEALAHFIELGKQHGRAVREHLHQIREIINRTIGEKQ